MWDIPRPGIKLVFPALAGRSLPLEDQGSPRLYFKKESHLPLGTIKNNVLITQPFSEHLWLFLWGDSEVQVELLSWAVTLLWLFYCFAAFWVWVFCSHLPFPLRCICWVRSYLCSPLVWLCGFCFLGLFTQVYSLRPGSQSLKSRCQRGAVLHLKTREARPLPASHSFCWLHVFLGLSQLVLRPSSLCLYHLIAFTSLSASCKAHLSVDEGPSEIIHSNLLM